VTSSAAPEGVNKHRGSSKRADNLGRFPGAGLCERVTGHHSDGQAAVMRLKGRDPLSRPLQAARGVMQMWSSLRNISSLPNPDRATFSLPDAPARPKRVRPPWGLVERADRHRPAGSAVVRGKHHLLMAFLNVGRFVKSWTPLKRCSGNTTVNVRRSLWQTAGQARLSPVESEPADRIHQRNVRNQVIANGLFEHGRSLAASSVLGGNVHSKARHRKIQ